MSSQEANKKKLKGIRPSVDLLTASHNHVRFLEECDQLPALRDEGILRQALYRLKFLKCNIPWFLVLLIFFKT